MCQVGVVHLIKVAAEDASVEPESEGPEPDRQGEVVCPSPETRDGVQGKRSEDVDLSVQTSVVGVSSVACLIGRLYPWLTHSPWSRHRHYLSFTIHNLALAALIRIV